MGHGPDIVVTDGYHFLLRVVVRATGDLDRVTSYLREVMQRTGCRTGLAIVGQRLRVLRGRVGGVPAGSVDMFALDAPTTGVPALVPPGGADADVEFERRVQAWLESLRDPSVVAGLPSDLRVVVDSYVLDAVTSGDVGAAGFRVETSAAE